MEKKGKEQLESQLVKIKRELRRKERKLQKYTQVLGAKQHVRETIERQRLVSEEQSASGSRHNESQDLSNIQFMSNLSRMVTFSADEPEVIFVTPTPDVKSKSREKNHKYYQTLSTQKPKSHNKRTSQDSIGKKGRYEHQASLEILYDSKECLKQGDESNNDYNSLRCSTLLDCDENNSANENEIANAKSLIPYNAEAFPVIEMPLVEDMIASDINEPVEQFPRKDIKSLSPTTQINVKKSTHRTGHPSLSRRNSEVCVEPVCFPLSSSSSQSTETNVLLSSSPVNPKQMDQYVDILSMDNYSSSGNQTQSNIASLNNFDGRIQEKRKQGVENQSMETNVLLSSSVNPKQMDQIVLSMDNYSSGNQAQSNRAPLNKIDCKIKEDSTHKIKLLFSNAKQSQDLFSTQSKKGKEKLEVSRKVLSQRERRQHHRTASQSSSSEGSTTGTVKQGKRRFIVNVDTEHKVDSHTSHKQPKRVEDVYSDDVLSAPGTVVQDKMSGQRFIINADTEQQSEDFHTPGTETRKQPKCREDMCGDDILSEELMIKEMEREVMKDATSSNDIFLIAKEINTNLGEKLMIKEREREVMKEATSNDVFFISREIDTALEPGKNHTVNEEAKVIKEMEIDVIKDATSKNDVFLIAREIDTTLKPATTCTSGETREESVVNKITNTTFDIVKSHEQYNKDVSRHADTVSVKGEKMLKDDCHKNNNSSIIPYQSIPNNTADLINKNCLVPRICNNDKNEDVTLDNTTLDQRISHLEYDNMKSVEKSIAYRIKNTSNDNGEFSTTSKIKSKNTSHNTEECITTPSPRKSLVEYKNISSLQCNGEVAGIKDFGKVLTTNFISTRCSSPWLLIVQELGLSIWKKKVNSEVWEADSTAPYPVARSSGVRNVVAVVLKSSEEVRFLVVSPSVSKDVLHIVYAQFNHQEREWIITKTDCSSTLWYLGDTSTCCALDDWTIILFCKQHQMPSTLPMLIIVDFDVTFSSRRKEWDLVCHPHTRPLSQDEYFTSLVPLSMSDAAGVVLCSTHTHVYIFDVFNSTRIARLKLPELTPFWAIAHKELIFMLSKNKEKKEICLCALNPVTGNTEDIFSWSHNSGRSVVFVLECPKIVMQ
ncbi:hypothetical protein Pcinc_013168 [Petrolisthes cinctipes]|uniref:Uncharacterized protein n=1 Tax=Petrolisthes cinctipes TaxID=88211 RepID=A0AAE1FZ74_PETCI|nr:hypothetical protein Pcinc_013168 [Petrolisthes cinctipes]